MTDKTAPRTFAWNAKGQKLVDDLVACLGPRIGTEDSRRAFANETLLGLRLVLPVAYGLEHRRSEAERLLDAAQQALDATNDLRRRIADGLDISRQLHDKAERSVRKAVWPEPESDSALSLHVEYLAALVSLAKAEVEASPSVQPGRKTGQAHVLVEWTALCYRLHFEKWPGQTKRVDAKTPFLRVCEWLTTLDNRSGWRGRISAEVVASGIAAAKKGIRHAEAWNATYTPKDPKSHLDKAIRNAMRRISTGNSPKGRLIARGEVDDSENASGTGADS